MTQKIDTESQALLQSFALGDIQLRNRVVLAPMTRARAGIERMPNALMAEYYAQRAGAGLLITEATTVSAQGNGWVESPGVYTDAQGEAWKQVVDAVHAKGSPIFLQLWHCGRASHSDFHGGELPVAPSPIKNGGEYVHTPLGKKGLRGSRVPCAPTSFRVSSPTTLPRRAAPRRAGFDGVEIPFGQRLPARPVPAIENKPP